MTHSLYKYDENKQTKLNNKIQLSKGDLPSLTYVDIFTDMKFNLSGSKINNFKTSSIVDSTNDIEDEFYTDQQTVKTKKLNKNIWESKLQFRYSTNWRLAQNEWDYKFSLKTINSIKLSKKWVLSYLADFNLKEKEMTYHSLRIYRPLHCWEFSFNYWPRGASAGFSLKINVRNPDLQDIKVTSKSSNRGFGGF